MDLALESGNNDKSEYGSAVSILVIMDLALEFVISQPVV
ncbi:MAG: hypothetical protein PWP14_1245 [Methanolobus sp.]|nr:hypothetical protein [Methanolobus sp.]